MKLSVAIITYNEQNNIRRTLEPLLDLADEIVIVDSFSTDQTIEIAQSMGAKVYQESWAGFIRQKNSCLEKCNGEWLLSLDADEVINPELKEAIQKVISDPAAKSGYYLNRRTFYMGKLLKYAWQPDRKLRLARRSANPAWTGTDPHETMTLDSPPARSDVLPGYLAHYSYSNFADHMERSSKYARGMAEQYLLRGKSSSLGKIMFKPPFVFFKRAFLQGAILDGAPGIIASISSAMYVYMKYAYLWELQKNRKPGQDG